MEVDREMTMDEIKREFDSEWVLIHNPETDEGLNVLGGRVRFHTKSRDQLDDACVELGPANRKAVLFIGSPPEDMHFLL